jgi:hypothetical protein
MTEGAPLVGLRTSDARHIENWVYATAAEDNRRGAMIPLCGEQLDRATTKRQKLDRFSPAVICPRCIEVARRWYAAFHFVPWTSFERGRLLEALAWDLGAVA